METHDILFNPQLNQRIVFPGYLPYACLRKGLKGLRLRVPVSWASQAAHAYTRNSTTPILRHKVAILEKHWADVMINQFDSSAFSPLNNFTQHIQSYRQCIRPLTGLI